MRRSVVLLMSVADASDEDSDDEEENEKDFMCRYFTREPQDEFFDEDDDRWPRLAVGG